MEQEFREFLQRRDHVSFAELDKHISGFGGTKAIALTDYPNVILWPSVSDEAAELIEKLKAEGVFHFHGSSLFLYMIDGKVPNLPIVKRKVQYKKLHWYPCVLKRGPAPCREKNCPFR